MCVLLESHSMSEPERLHYKDYQKAAKKAKDESLEKELERQLKDRKIGGFEREYRFNPERRWRFDFAWPNPKVAVEIDGGIYQALPGRHNRGAGMEKDNEKLNWAVSRGWKPLRFGPNAIKSGEAPGVVETTLAYWSNGRGDAA
jgi:very-short-patch-repair endonuclease